jgi:hypothetical protein
MAVATTSSDDSASERTGERTLPVALSISLLVHAITIGMLRGVLPPITTYAQGGIGNLPALQAVLAGPKSEPAPEPPLPEPAIDPGLVVPPAANPIETPIQRPSPPTAPVVGGGPSRSGSSNPDISIAVGLIDDPVRLGPGYVPRLALRFPERVSKPPQLFGAPIVMYPPAALAAGTEQRIAALLMLDANGKIVESELIPNDPLFGPVVLEALKNAQFTAAEIDTTPVPYWAIVEFVFMLERPSAQPTPKRVARPSFRQPSVGK